MKETNTNRKCTIKENYVGDPQGTLDEFTEWYERVKSIMEANPGSTIGIDYWGNDQYISVKTIEVVETE